MDRELEKKWFDLPVKTQMANVGSEVLRAIKWKNKGDSQKEYSFYEKAQDFLMLTIRDPKNFSCLNELKLCSEELNDYFIGSNVYGTSEAILKKYYDSFL